MSRPYRYKAVPHCSFCGSPAGSKVELIPRHGWPGRLICTQCEAENAEALARAVGRAMAGRVANAPQPPDDDPLPPLAA